MPDPATKKLTSYALSPTGLNSRCFENAWTCAGNAGSKVPNSTGELVGLAALALTANPVPADPGANPNTTPRGEFVLKKSGGKAFGSAKLSGTPSQLISRRPAPPFWTPARLGFRGPSAARKASTADWIAAGSAPAAANALTPAVGLSPKSPPASEAPSVTVIPVGFAVVWVNAGVPTCRTA